MFGSRHKPKAARLGAFLAGDLPREECEQVEAHVAECDLCARALTRMRQARELLLGDVVDQPPGGWDRIDAGVRAAIRVSSSIDGIARGELEQTGRVWWWWVLAPAAVATAALAVAYTGGFIGEPPPVVRVNAPVAMSSAPEVGEAVVAVVNLREGPDAHVSIGPDRDAAWRVLSFGEPLPDGTRVRTVSGARLGMQLGPADRLVLSGDAEVELRLLETSRKEVRLIRGTTVAGFAGNGVYRISTLDHDFVASGAAADFVVRREADHTIVDVYEGTVVVSAVGRPDVEVFVTALKRVVLPHHVDVTRRKESSLVADELAALRALARVPIISDVGAEASRDALAALTGVVLITSPEPGAEVRIDGKPYGVTDLVLRLTLGVHTIGFFRDGIETHSEIVDIVPGGKLQRVRELMVDPRRAIRQAIKARVRSYMPRMRGCYERLLKHDPEAAGRVVVHFTVEADGHVSAAEATIDTLPDRTVARCLLGEVGALKFPSLADAKPIRVKYPFIFAPATFD